MARCQHCGAIDRTAEEEDRRAEMEAKRDFDLQAKVTQLTNDLETALQQVKALMAQVDQLEQAEHYMGGVAACKHCPDCQASAAAWLKAQEGQDDEWYALDQRRGEGEVGL